MSDHFITDITGVPVTGSYGTDGKPSGINNDGGTETTPQDAGNVPSAGTESREGMDNDKSVTGNPYNPNASGTDTQTIGLGSSNMGPKQSNKYSPDAQRLFNSQFRNDPSNNIYAKDSFNHYKGESPPSSIEPTYESSFNIQGGGTYQSGDAVGSLYLDSGLNEINNPGSTLTTSVGGAVYTSFVDPNVGPGPVIGGDGTNPYILCTKNSSGLIDVNCEFAECVGGQGSVQLGKKMRIFQGQGCKKSGYWVQMLDTSYDQSDEQAQENALNCDFWRKSDRRGKGKISQASNLRKCGSKIGRGSCIKVVCQDTTIPPKEHNAGYTYTHKLMYVGTTLDGIKNKEWCAFEDEHRFNPPLTVAKSGWTEWFFEGDRCTLDGTRDEVTHSGKLYSCCCKTNPEGEVVPSGYELTLVGDLTAGTSGDPCDCRRRKENGPNFLPEVTGAGHLKDEWFTVLMTGCNQEAALDHYIQKDDNLYCIATGKSGSFGDPYWSESDCAWIYWTQRVARCDGEDPDVIADPDNAERAIKIKRYCPSGAASQTLTDRTLFPTPTTEPGSFGSIDEEDMINYAWCQTGNCVPNCTSGAALFAVGEYVTINSATQSAMTYLHGAWDQSGTFDLSSSGASCNGIACGFNVGVVSGLSGCDILSDNWKVSRREWGNHNSEPDSRDCTWGYQIEFTGCTPCSGSTPVTCDALGTGMAPNYDGPFREWFIPESSLTSGSGCTGDASCGPCVFPVSMFEVGDYVKIDQPDAIWIGPTTAVSGYVKSPFSGGFYSGFLIDFAVSGNGQNHTSTEPFYTGCAGGDETAMCSWVFSETGAAGPQYPGIGHWELDSSGLCGDCCLATKPNSGLQPDGTYIANHFDIVSLNCGSGVSGCDVLTQSWKITAKTSGDKTSDPDSLDCTWGYQIQFTGCPSSSGICETTGSAPYGTYDWIPEIYLVTGSGC